MAASQQHYNAMTSGGRPHNLKTEFDMDTFFDFNQGGSQPSPATASSSRGGQDATPKPSNQDWNLMSPFEPTDERQIYNGPSHDYGAHKQHVGMPMGIMNTIPPVGNAMYDGYNSGMGDMNFNSGLDMGYNSGIDLDADMNMDFGNPQPSMQQPAMFYPPTTAGPSNSTFIDPNNINQSEPPIGRVWPGMHSQQAQQAAMQKQQQAQAMQQRQMKIQAQNAQYRQAANQGQGLQQQPQGQSQGKRASHVTEPHVEESISRLLHQMRQNSAVSSGDDADSPGGVLPHIARMRKEEEDMDEDERLLASEEGKKLSSKERRQLRNKVSARAFRSRRKEYISQLEGEVAMKNQEVQNYKNENSALYQENERYRGLIETLLRHPAFTPFIDDISKNPAALGLGQQQQQQQQQASQQMKTSQQPTPVPQQPQQQAAVEDTKPDFLNFDASQVQIPTQQSVQQQSNEQVGLSMIPEENFSKLNLGGFAQQPMNFNNFKQVNAYAVTSMPKGPDPVTLLANSAVHSPLSSARRAQVDESAPLGSDATATAASSPDFSVLLAKLDGTARHSTAYTVKLAPTRLRIARITTLTTSRPAVSYSHGIRFLTSATRKASARPSRKDHPHDPDRVQQERKVVLPQLQSLLADHQPATPRGDEASGRAPAPPSLVRYYERDFNSPPTHSDELVNRHTQNRRAQRLYQDTRNPDPTYRWRQRKTIGRSRAPETATAPSTNNAPAAASDLESGHILFDPATHLPRLLPFGHTTNRRYRNSTHVETAKMKSTAQILTVPTADTAGTTLLLHFDSKRYLFGSLSEGTQRACIQLGARLAKVGDIFITGKSEWRNTGGLIGMILSLADVTATSREAAVAANGGVAPVLSEEEVVKKVFALARGRNLLGPDGKVGEGLRRELEDVVRKAAGLRVTGPEGIAYGLATARRFVFRKGLPVDVHEVGSGEGLEGEEKGWAPYWADENIKVWALKVLPGDEGRPVNPRKRNSDEAFGEAGGREQAEANGKPRGDDITQKQRDQLTVKAVIGDMFNSSWRMDSLTESLLSEVSLPATLFQRNPETHKIEKYSGPMPGANPPPDPNIKVLVRKPWPGALVDSLPIMQPSEEAISYIVRCHTQRGKFNPQAAMALKVPKGQKWSQLAGGSDVVNEDGETITPEQVLGESKEGGGVAIVDLPHESYCEALVKRPEWRQPEIMTGVGAIVWNLGAGVAENAHVKAFMEEFAQLKHIVTGVDVTPNTISLDSAAAATVRLRKVDPSRYGVPDHDNSAGAGFATQQWPANVQVAQRGQQVQLMPNFEVQNSLVREPLDIAATEAEVSPEVLDEAQKAQTALNTSKSAREEWAATVPCPEAEVITLGTGSALPSKYRNVSATLLRVPNWGNVLFDCGENTLGQLKRVFSPTELREVLQNLRIITISHMHADHHLGTVSVIKAWYQTVHAASPAPALTPTEIQSLTTESVRDDPSSKRLAVVTEAAMQHWLLEYSRVEDYGYSRLAPLNLSAGNPRRATSSRLSWFVAPQTLSHLAQTQGKTAMHRHIDAHLVHPHLIGLQDLQAVHVQHCRDARAVALTFPSSLSPSSHHPFKVSYSGDCRPSPAFAAIGANSTVCVHEATFDDELAGDALAKKHSTTSEALGVAQKMRARAAVLTHFSQRYQKLPVLEYEGSGNLGSGGENGVGLGELEAEEEDGEEGEAEAEAEAPMEVDEPAAVTDVGGNAPVVASEHLSAPPTTVPYLPATANGASTAAYAAKQPPPAGPESVKFKLTTDMRVAVAFDYMRVKVGEIAEMEFFTPALLKLLEEEDKKLEGEGAEDGAGEGKNGKAGGAKKGKKGGKGELGAKGEGEASREGKKGKGRRFN